MVYTKGEHMKRKRFFELHKILMIGLIISFSLLIAVIGGVEVLKTITAPVSETQEFDDQNYVYKN